MDPRHNGRRGRFGRGGIRVGPDFGACTAAVAVAAAKLMPACPLQRPTCVSRIRDVVQDPNIVLSGENGDETWAGWGDRLQKALCSAREDRWTMQGGTQHSAATASAWFRSFQADPAPHLARLPPRRQEAVADCVQCP